MSSVGWIPVTALSIGIFMDATGVGPIPFVIANEVFMVQVSNLQIYCKTDLNASGSHLDSIHLLTEFAVTALPLKIMVVGFIQIPFCSN